MTPDDLDVKTLLAAMKKGDLPPALNAEYWRAQLNRQTFEEKAGQLWHTSKVETLLATVFKTCRQQISLFADTVENQTKLSEDQRAIIREMSDRLITDIGEGLRGEMAFWDGTGDKETSDSVLGKDQ
jgi:hypothetical protein